jgi:hypothetical protein
MTIGHWLSGVSGENARAGLKPDTPNLKPMLGEGFTTPDNVPKSRAIFIVFYAVCINARFLKDVPKKSKLKLDNFIKYTYYHMHI